MINAKVEMTKEERKRLRRMRTPVVLQTANGIITVHEEVDVFVKELGNEKVTALVVEDSLEYSSLLPPLHLHLSSR